VVSHDQEERRILQPLRGPVLRRLNPREYRRTWLLLTLPVIGVIEIVLVGTSIAMFVACISSLASCRTRPQRTGAVALGKATLVYLAYLALLFVTLGKFNVGLGRVPILALAYGPPLLLALTSKLREAPTTRVDVTPQSRVLLLPGLGFLSLVVFGLARNDLLTPWIMSGDGRNHVQIARETVTDGGFSILPGYPAFANALVSLTGGWRFGTPDTGGTLREEVWVLAGVATVLLIGISYVISSLTAGGNHHSRKTLFLSVVVGTVAFSSLLLHNTLVWGFFSNLLVIFVILVQVLTQSDPNSSWRENVFNAVCGAIIIGLTFPPLAVLPVLLVASWGAMRVRPRSRRLPWGVIGGIASSLLLYAILIVLPIEAEVRRQLDLTGTLTPLRSGALVGIWVIAIITGLIAPREARHLKSQLVTVLGGVTVLYLYLGRTLVNDYYPEKTLWIGVTVAVMLIGVVVVRDQPFRGISLRAVGAALLAGGTVLSTYLPVWQDIGNRPVVSEIPFDWRQPSVDTVRQVMKVNGQEPRAMGWYLSSDYLENQLAAIWLSLDFSPPEDNLLWGYRVDVRSLDEVCSLAERNPPSRVAVTSEQAAKVVELACEGLSREPLVLQNTERKGIS
jgi:hypothetical protein